MPEGRKARKARGKPKMKCPGHGGTGAFILTGSRFLRRFLLLPDFPLLRRFPLFPFLLFLRRFLFLPGFPLLPDFPLLRGTAERGPLS